MTKNETYTLIGGSIAVLSLLGITYVVVNKKLKNEDPAAVNNVTTGNGNSNNSNTITDPIFGSGSLVPEDFGYSIGDDIEAIKFLELRKVEKIKGVWTNIPGTAVFNPGDKVGEIITFQRDYYDPSKLYFIIEESGFNWGSPEYYRLDATKHLTT